MQMVNSNKNRETIWIYNRAHCDIKKSETAKTRHPSVQIHQEGNRTSFLEWISEEMLSIKRVFKSTDFVSLLKLQASWRSLPHESLHPQVSGIAQINSLCSWCTSTHSTVLLPG